MDSPITGNLVRSSVPASWHVADKSGSDGFGTRNYAAILFPPHHAPIVLVIMTTHDQENASSNDALVAEAAKIALTSLVPEYTKPGPLHLWLCNIATIDAERIKIHMGKMSIEKNTVQETLIIPLYARKSAGWSGEG